MSYPSTAITFREFSARNLRRCETVWHSVAEWNPLEWAGAAAGEVGECANLCKKLRRRGRFQAAIPTEAELAAIGREIADAVTYLDLLASSLGLRLEDVLVDKFNEVSERVGYIKPGEHNGERLYVDY